MSKAAEVMLCGHCGKQAAFKVMAQNDGTPVWSDTYSGEEIVVWRVLQCTSCGEATLEQSIIEYSFYTGPDGSHLIKPIAADKRILYPGEKTRTPLANIPKLIEKEYEATLKVRDISSNACAVLARRTLEAIFTHENAIGNTLMQKVDNLIKSERIPPLLADVAHLGRQIGNLGAHFVKEEVTEEDVAAMLDFLEAILEYLYVLPAKVATVKARLYRTPGTVS